MMLWVSCGHGHGRQRWLARGVLWVSCGHGHGRQRWLTSGVRGHLQLVHGVGAQPEILRPERELAGTDEILAKRL